jgi:hypothetical protein
MPDDWLGLSRTLPFGDVGWEVGMKRSTSLTACPSGMDSGVTVRIVAPKGGRLENAISSLLLTRCGEKSVSLCCLLDLELGVERLWCCSISAAADLPVILRSHCFSISSNVRSSDIFFSNVPVSAASSRSSSLSISGDFAPMASSAPTVGSSTYSRGRVMRTQRGSSAARIWTVVGGVGVCLDSR